MENVLPEDAGEVLQQQLAEEGIILAESDGIVTSHKSEVIEIYNAAFEQGRRYGRLERELEMLQKGSI